MLVLDVNIILERIRWCVTIVVILDFEKKNGNITEVDNGHQVSNVVNNYQSKWDLYK